MAKHDGSQATQPSSTWYTDAESRNHARRIIEDSLVRNSQPTRHDGAQQGR